MNSDCKDHVDLERKIFIFAKKVEALSSQKTMFLSKKVKSIQENVEPSSHALIFNDIIRTSNFLFPEFIAWKKELWIK